MNKSKSEIKRLAMGAPQKLERDYIQLQEKLRVATRALKEVELYWSHDKLGGNLAHPTYFVAVNALKKIEGQDSE